MSNESCATAPTRLDEPRPERFPEPSIWTYALFALYFVGAGLAIFDAIAQRLIVPEMVPPILVFGTFLATPIDKCSRKLPLTHSFAVIVAGLAIYFAYYNLGLIPPPSHQF